jgi:hypothetical protein
LFLGIWGAEWLGVDFNLREHEVSVVRTPRTTCWKTFVRKGFEAYGRDGVSVRLKANGGGFCFGRFSEGRDGPVRFYRGNLGAALGGSEDGWSAPGTGFHGPLFSEVFEERVGLLLVFAGCLFVLSVSEFEFWFVRIIEESEELIVLAVEDGVALVGVALGAAEG